ncbi:MAG: hypothetical protein B6244_14720, partial [Candidatus Cloacimonetes bacterium 4572_55]
MNRALVLVVSLLVVLSLETTAGALQAPFLSKTVNGTTFSASWASVPDATGYQLIYAPSPYTGPETIQSADLGNITNITYSLWNGAAFYIAVKSYNDQDTSGYSNIEHIVIQLADVTDGL